jgi:hypothetical protein
MRQVFLGLGVLMVAGFVATLALREAADEVLGPGIDEATDNVEAFAATQNGRYDSAEVDAFAPIGEVEFDATLPPQDPSELGWAEEVQPSDSMDDYYAATPVE